MKTTSFVIALSESPRAAFGKETFSQQGPEQQVFSAVFGSSGSIFMDGFAGYFANSNGDSAGFAAEAYRMIGAAKSADIIERAVRVLSPDPIPEDQEARVALVEKLSAEDHAKLEELGEEFYSTGEILDDLLFDFVKKHAGIFGPIPDDVEYVKP